MKLSTSRRLSLFGLSLGTLLLAAGCNGDGTTITFLDVLNTVLLGITAAGAIGILRNL
jgi:hypothetical protein